VCIGTRSGCGNRSTKPVALQTGASARLVGAAGQRSIRVK
jgi:hypothetical protein